MRNRSIIKDTGQSSENTNMANIDEICLKWSKATDRAKIVENSTVSKFPLPKTEDKYEDYVSTCLKWILNTKTSVNLALLPLPLSLSLNIPPKPDSIQFSRSKVLNRLHCDELYDILIKGSNFNESSKFMPQNKKEDIFISQTISSNNRWGSKLIPQFPTPYAYDNYETYKSDLEKWTETVKGILDPQLEIDAKEFKQLLDLDDSDPPSQVPFIQTHFDYENFHPKNSIEFTKSNKISELFTSYKEFLETPLHIEEGPFDDRLIVKPDFDDIIALLDKQNTTDFEKQAILKYITKSIKSREPTIFTQIFNSVSYLWSLIISFQRFYETDYIENPIITNLDELISSGKPITTCLLLLSKYYLTQEITFIMSEHFASTDVVSQLNFAKEMCESYIEQSKSQITHFFEEEISSENIELASMVLKLLIWSKQTTVIPNFFKILYDIKSISKKYFRSIVYFIYTNVTSCMYFYHSLGNANLENNYFDSEIIFLISEFFTRVKPDMMVQSTKWTLQIVSQCIDIIVQSPNKIYSNLIKSVCKYAHRYYKNTRKEFQDIFPMILVLLYALGQTHLPAEIKLDLIIGLADLSVFPSADKVWINNLHQIQIILAYSLENEEISDATWKLISNVVITHRSNCDCYLSEETTNTILNELISGKISRIPITKALIRVVLSMPASYSSIPPEYVEFFNIFKGKFDFKSNLLNYLKKNNNSVKIQRKIDRIDKRPYSTAIYNLLSNNIE